MKRFPLKGVVALLLCVAAAQTLSAFCGFYVAKADASLFNNTSEVILVRDGVRSVVTMHSDFQGDVSEFAMVVPVPVVLKQKDIRVVDHSLFQKINDYSAPRLVEYHEDNPCARYVEEKIFAYADMAFSATSMDMITLEEDKEEYGVTIEAQYMVGEYDILILSATDSKGLKSWLTDNGYKIPGNAHEVLDPYIRNQLKFFVVKVNEDAYAKLGGRPLSPIQLEYESDRFMLPIRLGMANSRGTQDMVVYAFTRTGRIECTNYRTVEMPTGNQIPTFVKQDFGDFYVDTFDRQYRQQGRNAVFLEYAWNVTPNWGGMKCDPCVGPAPIYQDLATAGVDWGMRGENVFFTRMHVRYSRDKFPSDLQFQVTPNQAHYQARYVLTHSASGDFSCTEGQAYLKNQRKRRVEEVENLEVLAGWSHHKAGRYIKELDHLMDDTPQEDRGEVLPPASIPEGPRGPGAGVLVLFGFLAFVFGLKLLGRYRPRVVTS